MNHFVVAKELHATIHGPRLRCLGFFICYLIRSANASKITGRFVAGLITISVIVSSHVCYAQEPAQQQTLGSVVRWTEPLKSSLEPPIKIKTFRIEPPGSCRLDLSLDDPQHPTLIIVTAVFLKPGEIRLTNGSLTDAKENKITLKNRSFSVKDWPARPLGSAIQAGVGPLRAAWIFDEDQKPQAGKAFTLRLRLEDLASLGVDRPPAVSIKNSGSENATSTGEPELLTALNTNLHYDRPEQTWEYVWTPAAEGRYRIEPILFSHLVGDRLQTVMLRGVEFDVQPREFKSFAPVNQPPESNQADGSWRWILIPVGLLLISAGATHSLMRKRVRTVAIRMKLRRIKRAKLERTAALDLYRSIEKDWYANPKSWNSADQARMKSLSELAFAPDRQ